MFATHLRRNAVAYAALLVALTTGSAYAAQALPRHSVGAQQLKKSAVTSKAVKNGTIGTADLAPGVVPALPVVPPAAWVGAQGTNTPSATPDISNIDVYTFSVPSAGNLLVSVVHGAANGSCTAGAFQSGLYVDGRPVPGSRIDLTSVATVRVLAGTIPVAAGTHVVWIGNDCPTGTTMSYGTADLAYTLVLGQ